MSITLNFKKEVLPLILGSLLLFFATPPCDIFPLSYIAIFIAFLSLKNERSSFLKGFIFGFIYNALTMYWISYVLRQYGNLPFTISLFLLILLISYLSLYLAIFFKIYSLFHKKIPLILQPPIMAMIWVLLEIVKANFLTGFPWMLIAYTQHNFLPLIQHSKTITVYGIGFLIIFVNFSFLILIKGKKRSRYLHLALSFIVAFFLVYSGQEKIKHLKESSKSMKSISISGIQGNIDQSKKWDKMLQKEIITKYLSLTEKTNAELVVWPETALPFVYGLDGEWTEQFKSYLKDKPFMLITGFVGVGYDEGKAGFTNSAGLFFKGELKGRYDKIHLVPFGEYVPLKKILFFVNKLVEAAGDFLQGKDLNVIEFKGVRIGTLICYEAIFPDISKTYKEKGANLLVNITNDAWFGKSSAPYQHLAMSRFRAVENELYLVRIANTGFSCVITPWGEILSKTKLFKEEVINETVYFK